MKQLILVSIALLTLSAQARTITVGAHAQVSTIREALALAVDGDTIRVQAGVYREGNILLEKRVVLIGESLPVIDGENTGEVITIRAPYAQVQGFRVINSGVSSMKDLAGIGVEDAHGAIIRDNILENTFFGIHVTHADSVVIMHNTLRAQQREEHHSGNGIHLWQCRYARIQYNYITHHRDGIYFEFVTQSLIDHNLSEGNLRYGLHFMFSNQDRYQGNIFRNNGAGVAVMYTHQVEMIDNTFEENWGSSAYGLLLKDITDSTIDCNQFVRNTVGIFLEGTNRSVFTRNVFSGNGWAVRLQANCDGNTFSTNNFLANTFDVATNGSLVINRFERNYWDRYEGYDMGRDGTGDVPYRPVSLYAMVVDRVPTSVMLWRSFLVFLLDKAERVVPAVTPENLKDDYPLMHAHDLG